MLQVTESDINSYNKKDKEMDEHENTLWIVTIVTKHRSVE